MPRPKSDRPAYCLHRQSGRGYVTIDGQQKLLPGAHESESTKVLVRIQGATDVRLM